ncbi:hypothetical protein GGI21_006735, partial [Coemansia aciculifera]
MAPPMNIASLVESNASQLKAGERVANALALFGPPQFMGSSLNDLRSPQSAVAPMPGIAMGNPNDKPAAGTTSQSGD